MILAKINPEFPETARDIILIEWGLSEIFCPSKAVVPDLFWQITLFELFEKSNYPQINGRFSLLFNKVQIQITLPKMAVYPRRVNYPSSGTTAEKNFKGGNFGIKPTAWIFGLKVKIRIFWRYLMLIAWICDKNFRKLNFELSAKSQILLNSTLEIQSHHSMIRNLKNLLLWNELNYELYWFI